MIVISLISGLLLGIIFFGGLWFTVKKALGTKYAGLWFLGSSLLRTGIVLTGLYFMAKGSLAELLVGAAGIIAARFLVLRFTRSLDQHEIAPKETA